MKFKLLFLSGILAIFSHSAISAGPISSMSSTNNSNSATNSQSAQSNPRMEPPSMSNNGYNNYYQQNGNMGNNQQSINPQYYQPIYNNGGNIQSPPMNNNDNLNYRSPLIATSNWEGWTLNLINLDNNNKPKDQTALDLAKEAIIKHKDLTISIFPDNLEENAGKVVRFVCEKSNIVLTQKFGAPDQLKGFALQMECNKQKYYFIVNPK